MPDQVRSRSYPLESLKFSGRRVPQELVVEGARLVNEMDRILAETQLAQGRRLEADRVIYGLKGISNTQLVLMAGFLLTAIASLVLFVLTSTMESLVFNNGDLPQEIFNDLETKKEVFTWSGIISGLMYMLLYCRTVLNLEQGQSNHLFVGNFSGLQIINN